jgi:hypothetical protein
LAGGQGASEMPPWRLSYDAGRHNRGNNKMTVEMKKDPGLFKGIMLAYFVLILHVLLIAGMGLLVIFFQGVVVYMPWIFIGGVTIILGSGYYFYRRLKASGQSLREALNSPLLQGKSFEVKFLGGMASFKVDVDGATRPPAALPSAQPTLRIEDTTNMRLRELTELARLLENDLISPDEYNRLKRRLFNN